MSPRQQIIQAAATLPPDQARRVLAAMTREPDKSVSVPTGALDQAAALFEQAILLSALDQLASHP